MKLWQSFSNFTFTDTALQLILSAIYYNWYTLTDQAVAFMGSQVV